MSQERQLLVDQVRRDLSNLTRLSVEDFTRPEQLGERYSLTEIEWPISRLLELGEDAVEAAPLTDLPRSTLEDIAGRLKTVHDYLETILDYSPDDQEVTKKEAINKAEEAYRILHESLAPIIAIGRHEGGRPAEELRSEVKSAKEELNRVRSQMRAYRDEAQEKIEHARKAAGDTGAVRQGEWFKQEATTAGKSAKKWLVATIILATLTLFTALAFLLLSLPKPPGWGVLSPSTWTTGQALQIGLSKFVILAVEASSTVWSARIYRANSHNQTVNRHRANTVKTFQAFSDFAESASTQDAVLRKGAASIFAPQPSGYLRGQRDAEQGPGLNTIDSIRELGNN